MIKPKKSLGQNFLIDSNIIQKIIRISSLKNKNVIEIGPGTGNLTKAIIKEKPKSLLIIEKDKKLAEKLQDLKLHNVNIVNEDILKINLEDHIKNDTIIIGNLPYNISSQILINLIKFKKWPPKYNRLILMFQKEVAEKIRAKTKSKNFGRITVMSNWRLKIKNYFHVSNNCFYPKPKVQSTVLVFDPVVNKKIFINDINNLEKTTRILFSNKRKMINKALSNIFKNSNDIASKLNIDITSRPNDLCEDTYYRIAELYEKSL